MMITDHACGSLPAGHADDQQAAAIPARGCAEDRRVAHPGAAVVWARTMIWSAFARSQSHVLLAPVLAFSGVGRSDDYPAAGGLQLPVVAAVPVLENLELGPPLCLPHRTVLNAAECDRLARVAFDDRDGRLRRGVIPLAARCSQTRRLHAIG